MHIYDTLLLFLKLQTLVCGLLVEYAIIVVMRHRACTQVLRIYFSRYIKKQRSIGLYGTDSLQTQKVFLHSLKNIYEKTITYQLQIQDKRTSLPQLVMAPNRQITRVCSSLDIGVFSGSERCLLFLFTCRWDKKNGFQSTSWIGVQFGIIANSTSILNGAEVVVEELGGVARLEPVGHGPHVGEQRSAGRLKVPSALGGRT